MLWLAGLMGLVGVGAASIAVVQLQQDDDSDDDIQPEEPNLEEQGNLLDAIAGLHSDDEVRTGTPAIDDFDEEEDDDILYSDIFGTQFNAPNDAVGLDQDTWTEDDPYDVLDTDLSETPVLPLSGYEAALGPSPLIGDWISSGDPDEIVEYDATQEQLVLVWDDMADGANEPKVDINPHPADPEIMQVKMNGASVADVVGAPGLSVAELALVPLSSALIAGMTPVAQKRPPALQPIR